MDTVTGEKSLKPAYNNTNWSQKMGTQLLSTEKDARTSTHSKGKPRETRRIKGIESQKAHTLIE